MQPKLLRRENGQPALRVRAYHLGFCTLGVIIDRAELARSNSGWLGALNALFDDFNIESWRFLAFLGKKLKIFDIAPGAGRKG